MASQRQSLAVENGRAGIHPTLIRDAVLSGAFDNIDVVNSHHYAGVESPEANYSNWNFHTDADELRQNAILFYDSLREAKVAGQVDGKKRQHWITEFGWDTKAGNIVSLETQAAFLARSYMMIIASGTEKGFWFFDLDSEQANQFFDGCGLLAEYPDHLPKPALAAMAGMTNILPSPEYIGMTFAGEGTWGYVFRQYGKYVVSLWTIDPVDDDAPSVEISSEGIFDLYGNSIPKGAQRLSMAPIYWVDVPADSPFIRQAAYAIDSRMLILTSAGDSFDILISSDPTLPGGAKERMAVAIKGLPENWIVDDSAAAIMDAENNRLRKTVRVTADPNAYFSEINAVVEITPDGAAAAVVGIPYRILVQPALSLRVTALGKTPQEETIKATVINRAQRTVNGKLRFELPEGWTARVPETPITDLKAGESITLDLTLTWTANMDPNSPARVILEGEDGSLVNRPLIPGQIAIVGTAGPLPLDGDPSVWPAETQLPVWIFGTSQLEPQMQCYTAWSPEGLYLGAIVEDSILRVTAPNTFWTGESIEIFLDMTTREDNTWTRGRHQFWLVPQPDVNKVYAGRWKRGDEIAATLYDMATIQGNALRRGDGYSFTVFIPKEVLDEWNPTVGATVGLNLNFSIKGRQLDREVFWPLSKSADSPVYPSRWGRAALGGMIE